MPLPKFLRGEGGGNKKLSDSQETSLAKKLRGKKSIASGALWFQKSDVFNEEVLAEAKVTRKKSYSLKLDDLEKNFNYALKSGKVPLFFVRFVDEVTEKVKREYAIIEQQDLIDLYDRLRELENPD